MNTLRYMWITKPENQDSERLSNVPVAIVTRMTKLRNFVLADSYFIAETAEFHASLNEKPESAFLELRGFVIGAITYKLFVLKHNGNFTF